MERALRTPHSTPSEEPRSCCTHEVGCMGWGLGSKGGEGGVYIGCASMFVSLHL